MTGDGSWTGPEPPTDTSKAVYWPGDDSWLILCDCPPVPERPAGWYSHPVSFAHQYRAAPPERRQEYDAWEASVNQWKSCHDGHVVLWPRSAFEAHGRPVPGIAQQEEKT